MITAILKARSDSSPCFFIGYGAFNSGEIHPVPPTIVIKSLQMECEKDNRLFYTRFFILQHCLSKGPHVSPIHLTSRRLIYNIPRPKFYASTAYSTLYVVQKARLNNF
jgi:hypothetical protein